MQLEEDTGVCVLFTGYLSMESSWLMISKTNTSDTIFHCLCVRTIEIRPCEIMALIALIVWFVEFLEGKTADSASSADDMDVDSDDQKDVQEEAPLLPPEAFLHNRADRLKEDGGASPAGNVFVSKYSGIFNHLTNTLFPKRAARCLEIY